jgi:hypothetical protein
MLQKETKDIRMRVGGELPNMNWVLGVSAENLVGACVDGRGRRVQCLCKWKRTYGFCFCAGRQWKTCEMRYVMASLVVIK